MSKLVKIFIVALVLAGAAVAVAHHAADGIVDEEIYAMIDALVADTPHADMTLDDLGGGMTEIDITTMTVQSVENLVDDGLLTYAAMLDGEVTVEISFVDQRSVSLTILQQE